MPKNIFDISYLALKISGIIFIVSGVLLALYLVLSIWGIDVSLLLFKITCTVAIASAVIAIVSFIVCDSD